MQSKIQEYEIVRKLGEGSFGEVLLGRKKNEQFAIKKLSKKQIIKVNKLHEPFIQKEILMRLKELCQGEELVIKIFDTQSDEDFMYLILEYCNGGTLQELVLNHTLSQFTVLRIAVKIVLILERFSSFGIVHRDLKPSNLLINDKGFIKVSDFGTAYAPQQFFTKEVAAKIKEIKQISATKQKQRKSSEDNIQSSSSAIRRSTFVGTACYMAPELLTQDICGKQADIWALGCILYEIIFRKSPFFDTSQGMVWKKILNQQIQLPKNSSQYKGQNYPIIKDLIQKLLIKDKDKRLGSGQKGFIELKNHEFFKGVDWNSEAKHGIEEIINIVKTNLATKQVKMNKKKGEKVILSGVVNKKMFFGNFKQRMMILYSTPKLVYYCTQTGEKKGEILLQKNTPIGVDGKTFTVTNEKKTYYFKCKNCQEWQQMIQSAVLNAFY